LLSARKVVRDVYMDDRVKDYIVDVVFATRDPSQKGMKELQSLIEYGASPRASIASRSPPARTPSSATAAT
jgi:MoxR-like ATPase